MPNHKNLHTILGSLQEREISQNALKERTSFLTKSSTLKLQKQNLSKLTATLSTTSRKR